MESANYYYIVQEYCNGGELRAFMEKKGPLVEPEALGVLGDICNGFVCMLSQGVVHRYVSGEVGISSLRISWFIMGASRSATSDSVRS